VETREGVCAMVDFLMFHAAEVTIYISAMLIVFVLARLVSVGPVLALIIAITPAGVAWVYLTPSAHGLVAHIFG
jgi:hypothetical protein